MLTIDLSISGEIPFLQIVRPSLRVQAGSAMESAIETVLVAAIGCCVSAVNGVCVTTTSTSTTTWPSTYYHFKLESHNSVGE
jgi:ribose/xylose/arabinose/galactoside ABC-type transport system permease subunit